MSDTARSPERPDPKRADSIGFVPQLESLRGVAALMVAAMHASQPVTGTNLTLASDSRSWSNPFWGGLFKLYYPVLSNGDGAVMVFFVLSGFVLASSIERGPQGTWPAARHFFVGRVFRLFPAIIFTVLLFTVIFLLTGAMIPGVIAELYRADNILRNMLLIDTNIDGVMWTLRAEAVAIPVIFAVTMGQRRFGLICTLAVIALIIPFSFSRPFKHVIADDRSFRLLYAFMAGIAIHRIGSPLLRRIGRKILPWVIAGTLLLFFLPRPILGLLPIWPPSRWPPFCECVAAMGVIAVLVYRGETGFARLLNWKPLRFYGRISYSFYLLHPLSLLVLCRISWLLSPLLDAGVPAVLIAVALTIASVLAITPLAWLSWRFIEIPGIAAGRRLSPERRNASPYVGPHGKVLHPV